MADALTAAGRTDTASTCPTECLQPDKGRSEVPERKVLAYRMGSTCVSKGLLIDQSLTPVSSDKLIRDRTDKVKGRKKEFWWGSFVSLLPPKEVLAKKDTDRALCARVHRSPGTRHRLPLLAVSQSDRAVHPQSDSSKAEADTASSAVQSLHSIFPFLPFPFLFPFLLHLQTTHHPPPPDLSAFATASTKASLSSPSALCRYGHFSP